LPRNTGGTACVRCGWCTEDCPVGVDPRELSQLELREIFSPAQRASLSTCIECGICTYVCPSGLALTESISISRHRLNGAMSPHFEEHERRLSGLESSRAARPLVEAPPKPGIHSGHSHRQILAAWTLGAGLLGACGTILFGFAALRVIAVA